MRKHLREWIYSRGQHDRQQKQQGDARYGLDNRLKQHRLLFAQHNCQMQPFLLHRSSNSSSNRGCTSSGTDILTLSGRHSLPGTNCPPCLFLFSSACCCCRCCWCQCSPPASTAAAKLASYGYSTATLSFPRSNCVCLPNKGRAKESFSASLYCGHTVLLPGFAAFAAPFVVAFAAVSVFELAVVSAAVAGSAHAAF